MLASRADIKAFEQTVAIKRGGQSLEPAYAELARWVELTYAGVRVLNFFYEGPKTPHIWPRLRIIFEHEADVQRFEIAPLKYNRDELARIGARFKRLFDGRPFIEFERLIVVPSSFESECGEYVLHRIEEADLPALAAQDPSVWLVRVGYRKCIFFFFTDDQLERSKSSGVRDRLLNAYAVTIRKYDEFGYFTDRPPPVHFDSEENFQRRYRGSWLAYDH